MRNKPIDGPPYHIAQVTYAAALKQRHLVSVSGICQVLKVSLTSVCLRVRAGDSLEVLTYERLLPLKAEKAALGTLQAVRKGDCLVAFSRREVHAIKRALDAWGALKCCVVYGALPAEARTQQVQLLQALRPLHQLPMWVEQPSTAGPGLAWQRRRLPYPWHAEYMRHIQALCLKRCPRKHCTQQVHLKDVLPDAW